MVALASQGYLFGKLLFLFALTVTIKLLMVTVSNPFTYRKKEHK